MATGSREDFERVFHPQAVNREAAVEPPATREPGPGRVLRHGPVAPRARSPALRFEIHEAAEQDDLVVLHVTMSGRHTGDFASYQPGTATVDATMPPTGKGFAVTQTHWFRTRDGYDHRALGQPRRPGHGPASRMGTAVTQIPPARGARQKAGPEAHALTDTDNVPPSRGQQVPGGARRPGHRGLPYCLTLLAGFPSSPGWRAPSRVCAARAGAASLPLPL